MELLTRKKAVAEAKARWGPDGDVRRREDRLLDVYFEDLHTVHYAEVGYWVRTNSFLRRDRFVVMGLASSRDGKPLPIWEEAFLDAHRRDMETQAAAQKEKERIDKILFWFSHIQKTRRS